MIPYHGNSSGRSPLVSLESKISNKKEAEGNAADGNPMQRI